MNQGSATSTPPSSPTDCRTERITSTSVKFMWKAPVVNSGESQITNYKFTLTPKNGDISVYILDALSTEYVVHDIVLNTEYTASVTASNDNELSFGPDALFESFTLYPIQPTAPSNGGFMYISPAEIMVSWYQPSDNGGRPITQYSLTVTSSLGSPDTHILNGSTFHYSLKNVQHGTTLYAAVKASNDDGLTYGPEVQFGPIVGILPPSAPPASVTAVGVAPGIVDVSWTATPVIPEGNAYYYVMSQSSNPSDPSIGLTTSNTTQLSGRLTELNPASSYTFTIKVVNQVGSSTTIMSNPVPPTMGLAPHTV